MENFIINRKQISLEKNKEFSFKIPVLFTPIECEFILDRTDNETDEEVVVVFKLKCTKSGSESENKQLSVQVIERTTSSSLKYLDLQGEFLLLSCTANKNIQFAFSIRRNFSRTII